MTKYKFLVLAFLPFCLFADDLENYRNQVINDCNAVINMIDGSSNRVAQAAHISTQMLSTEWVQSNNYLSAWCNDIVDNCRTSDGMLLSLRQEVESIRYTAFSLVSSSNQIDYTSYLRDIKQSLLAVEIDVSSILAGMSEIVDLLNGSDSSSPFFYDNQSLSYYLASTNDYIERLFTDFFLLDSSVGSYNIKDFYDLFSSTTNKFFGNNTLLSISTDDRRYPSAQYNNGVVTVINKNASLSWNNLKNFSLLSTLQLLGQQSMLFFTSQQAYDYTNLVAVSSIARKMDMLTNTVDISSITNLLEEKFTIFNPSSPLDIYTQGSEQNYYQFLTNYYIKVSTGGTLSPSEPHTNWFSRIEMLLASLVFKDEGTNFVDNAENTSELENTLSQSVDTLSQAVSVPQNVTGKIDNMGQSFLGLLGEWRAIVSGNSLPSQFVLCDINLSSQNRDSSTDSSISSFRLETSLDSGEFRQFLDFCHAITTILFTMLFVWLSIMLLSFLLTSLAKLAQFCYLVYSALFGG